MTSHLLVAPFLLALISLVVGLWLVGIGIRGRRIGNDPHCRRCGFDLRGTLPERWSPDGSSRCPECGTVLARARDVTRGLKRGRPVALALGLMLLLPVLGALVFAGASSVNWNELKPTWVLLQDARSRDYREATAVAQELLLRANHARLTGEQLSRAFDACLMQQKRNPLLGSDPWSRLLAAAYAGGAVTESQRERHIRQLFATFYRTQPRLRDEYVLGEPFPFDDDAAVLYPDPLFNPTWSAYGRVLGMVAYLQSATLDGSPLELRPSQAGSVGDSPIQGSIGWWVQHGHPSGNGDAPAAFPEPCNGIVRVRPTVGSHELALSWRIEVFDLRPGEPEFEHPFREPDASWTTDMIHEFEVVNPASGSTRPESDGEPTGG